MLLFLGGFLGIGGSQQKTNRKIELGGYQDLSNIFNWALPTAKQTYGTAQSTLGSAQDYWSKILSGSRPAIQQAIAPETSMIRSASDAARRQLATSGTARGGGVAAANQQEADKSRAAIDQAIFGARPEAAKATAQIGSTELNAALNELGLGGDVASELYHGPGSSTNTGASAGPAAGQLAATALLGAFGF